MIPNETKERERFEAHVISKYGDRAGPEYKQSSDGRYLYAHVQHDWELWQAARRPAPQGALTDALPELPPAAIGLHDDGYFTWRNGGPHEARYAGWKGCAFTADQVIDVAFQYAQQCIEARNQQGDAVRLVFAMQDIDGFCGVDLDKYDYALQSMEENGRDEPSLDDELAGIRRLIDAAIEQRKADKKGDA